MTSLSGVSFALDAYLAVMTGGGITQHPFNGTQPTVGYAASYAHSTECCTWDDFSPSVVEDYIDTIDWSDPRVYFGCWLNNESNTVYLDRTRVFEDINSALAFAMENHQLAIYDIANNETLFLEQWEEGAA